MRFLDRRSGRLVYLAEPGRADNWDRHWSGAHIEQLLQAGRNGWFVKQTKIHLPLGSLILEGGCGCADKVAALHRAGYRVVGFDTAAQTLRRAHEIFPELALAVADIRRLPLGDQSIDGYWSLGVFEHFFDGMESQWREAHRAMKDGGMLFLTLPIMSPIRRAKAALGLYSSGHSNDRSRFYQYVYRPEEILGVAAHSGFQLVRASYIDGIKGLKDEVPFVRPVLQNLYDSKNVLARICRRILDPLIRSTCGHMAFFVFRKVEAKSRG